ncbi:sulfotransferase family protein [Dyella acidiphila]|uniref:Sulfotransferase n=1 Tax=Dyella acidiphila TaxID=2775866 RepID=A0ABR9GEC7_9GAMM|nr:sulfotransferase [Dyella acidiphila]MBE1162390.1 sulfotransferase [Dyella acidiphila]
MGKTIHFISGLPRSGSTLLSAILGQNPRFHAGMSGPMGGAFNTLLGELSGRNEYSMFITDEQRRRMLMGLFDNYYGPEYGAEVVFDTNRAWCSKMHQLKDLFPKGKVIACVRHVSWIIDSIEQLVRKNAFQPSSIFNYQPGGTVYSRAEGLANGDGLVGYSYNALKEAFYGEDTANLMLLRYETLVNDPARALAAVYAFIGEPAYQHDYANVSYQAEEFDQRAGTPGLHTVHRQVTPRERKSVLPPDVFRRFENDMFWLDPALNPRNVVVV